MYYLKNIFVRFNNTPNSIYLRLQQANSLRENSPQLNRSVQTRHWNPHKLTTFLQVFLDKNNGTYFVRENTAMKCVNSLGLKRLVVVVVAVFGGEFYQ